MCGITGFYQSTTLDSAALQRMTKAISHRGPDDEGFYFAQSSGTGLGHRRLSILDLSPLGHQPMTYENSGLWIVFNGEIYNFIEIRTELEQKGYRFCSDSDTEVILAAYLEWGKNAFAKFNGMWALALYDENRKELLLCRDRYGIKPLYYHLDKQQLVFGSEYKVFWAVARELSVSWDLRGIKTALGSAFYLESSGFTLLEKVRNLLPGHYLVANESGVEVHQWWRTLDHLVEVPATLEEQAEQLEELFRDACRLRLRSDVPVGTSLSGGIDSSSVVVMLSDLAYSGEVGERASKSWQKTFIHSFKGTSFDETDYADIAANAADAEKIYVTADPDELLKRLDSILYAFESIYPGMPDSGWRVYKSQRENGVIVSLDGHGADEMLGGYGFYVTAAMEDSSVFSSRFWSLLEQQRQMLGDMVPRYFTIQTILKSRSWIKANKELAKKILGNLSLNSKFLSEEAHKLEGYDKLKTELPLRWDALNQSLYQDFHHIILPRILKNFDLMSMAHGIEVRMPFMDYRLINYVFSLPSSSKIGEGYTKLVLRKAMSNLLPDPIRLRQTKFGFNSPLTQWLQNELKIWIQDTLESDSMGSDLVDMKKLKNFYNEKIVSGQFEWAEASQFWVCLNAIRLTQIMEKGV
ncbi:asparagine synthase (glutamine-hydrolyzing) [Microcoleus sp. FACHB-68]|nr:asparagine synthase (glutamine-hydrolyzing) [Microcoleus sp. FACHB-68]